MKVEVKKLNKLKRTIKVFIEGEELLNEKKSIYKELGKDLKVPGFRPGSAPFEVLEKHHGKLLKEEFLKRILPQFYSRALQENGIRPAGYPRIYDVELTVEALTFNAEFEVSPEFELKDSDYKGIKVKAKMPQIKDEEVNKVISNIKEGLKNVVEGDLDNDNLAKWAGYAGFADLNEAIKAEVLVQKMRERRRSVDEQVKGHLLKKVKIDIPDSAVERHHKELMDREIYNLQLKGLSEADLDKYSKELEEKLKPVAKEDVKLSYILDEVARKENLKGSNPIEAALGFILSKADYS